MSDFDSHERPFSEQETQKTSDFLMNTINTLVNECIPVIDQLRNSQPEVRLVRIFDNPQFSQIGGLQVMNSYVEVQIIIGEDGSVTVSAEDISIDPHKNKATQQAIIKLELLRSQVNLGLNSAEILVSDKREQESPRPDDYSSSPYGRLSYQPDQEEGDLGEKYSDKYQYNSNTNTGKLQSSGRSRSVEDLPISMEKFLSMLSCVHNPELASEYGYTIETSTKPPTSSGLAYTGIYKRSREDNAHLN